MFKLQFSTDNAAFRNEDETICTLEVGQLLHAEAGRIYNQIQRGVKDGLIFDHNGNHCGSWSLDSQEAPARRALVSRLMDINPFDALWPHVVVDSANPAMVLARFAEESDARAFLASQGV